MVHSSCSTGLSYRASGETTRTAATEPPYHAHPNHPARRCRRPPRRCRGPRRAGATPVPSGRVPLSCRPAVPRSPLGGRTRRGRRYTATTGAFPSPVRGPQRSPSRRHRRTASPPRLRRATRWDRRSPATGSPAAAPRSAGQRRDHHTDSRAVRCVRCTRNRLGPDGLGSVVLPSVGTSGEP